MIGSGRWLDPPPPCGAEPELSVGFQRSGRGRIRIALANSTQPNAAEKATSTTLIPQKMAMPTNESSTIHLDLLEAATGARSTTMLIVHLQLLRLGDYAAIVSPWHRSLEKWFHRRRAVVHGRRGKKR